MHLLLKFILNVNMVLSIYYLPPIILLLDLHFLNVLTQINIVPSKLWEENTEEDQK